MAIITRKPWEIVEETHVTRNLVFEIEIGCPHCREVVSSSRVVFESEIKACASREELEAVMVNEERVVLEEAKRRLEKHLNDQHRALVADGVDLDSLIGG